MLSASLSAPFPTRSGQKAGGKRGARGKNFGARRGRRRTDYGRRSADGGGGATAGGRHAAKNRVSIALPRPSGRECRKNIAFLCPGKMKKATSQNDVAVFFSVTYYTLCTLLERRQLVHTYMCFGVPFTRTFTLFTLGFQVLLDLLWEWETLIPKFTPFPQTSHFAMFKTPPSRFTWTIIIPNQFEKIKGF